MKKMLTILLIGISISLPVFADVFTTARPLHQIKTEHFTFIFPEEARGSAEYLSVRAEAMYKRVAELLNQPMNLHLPVVISPDTDQLNGYFSPAPSNRIVLYQAPLLPNSSFATYNNTLEKLFLHELTHAVSMNIRSPFYRVFAWLIGDIVMPAGLTSSQNFIEGVTVSFESLDGFGRANGTDYASVIQQDILEDRFMSFNETAGIRRNYPGGSWYIYGGWFSRYLQETYGMEAYAKLWKEFGAGNSLWDFLFFPGAFRKAYDTEFSPVWEDFRRWMSLKVPVVTQTLPLTEDWDVIKAVTARGTTAYYSGTEGLYEVDIDTGTQTRLAPMDSSVTRLSLSDDASKLLISAYESVEPGLSEAVVKLFNLTTRRYQDTDLSPGLSEAAFIGDHILAVRYQGYTTDLVLINPDGSEEVLFQGTANLIPSQPGSYEPGWVHFLLQRGGFKRLARLNLADKSVELLQPTQALGEIRNLTISTGNILFSWDNDLTLFKLGSLTADGLSLQTTPISGGIRHPARAGDQILYAGAFSMGYKLMLYPKENPALTLKHQDFTWVAMEEAEQPDIQGRDSNIRTALDFPAQEEPPQSRRYYPLSRVLLPQLRIPNIIFNLQAQNIEDLIQGAGLITMSSDPTESIYLDWDAAYLWNWKFADLGLTYTDTRLPLNLSLSVSDRFSIPASVLNTGIRTFSAILGLSDNITLFPSQRNLGWNLTSGVLLQSTGPGTDIGQTSPYEWDLAGPFIPINSQIAYTQSFGGAFPPYERSSLQAGLSWHGMVSGFDATPGLNSYARLTGGFTLPFLGLSLNTAGYLAFDDQVGFLPHAATLGTGLFPGNVLSPAWNTYATYEGDPSQYYINAQASSKIIFDIGKGLPGQLYLSNGYLSGGYRMAFLNTDYLDSVYAQAALTFHWGQVGTLQVLPLQLGIEIEYAIRKPEDQRLGLRLLSVLDVSGFM